MKSATPFLTRSMSVLAGLLLATVLAVPTAFGQIAVSGNGIAIVDADPAATNNGSDFGGLLAQVETDSQTFMITNGASTRALCDISFDGVGATTDGDFTLSFNGAQPTVLAPGLLHPTASVDFSVAFNPQDATNNLGVISVSVIEDDALDCSSPAAAFIVRIDGQGLLDFGDARTGAPGYSGVTNLAGDGARHVASGVNLGTRRDAEADATQLVGTELGDDDDAVTDDEDGLISITSLLSGTSASMIVDVSGSGYLNAFIDGGDDGTFTSDQIVDDLAVVDGLNAVAFDVPVAVTASTVLRLRVCAAANQCDDFDGLVANGEVEDYEVALVAATGAVSITLSGTAANLALSGLDVVVTDENGNVLFSGPQATIGVLTITGDDATAETVTVAPDAIPAAGLALDLGTGTGDALAISAGTAGAVTHVFDNANDGTVYIDAYNIAYLGLDPISDLVVAATRTFTFANAVADTVVVTANGDGAAGNGISFIDSNGSESVSFANPTANMVINGDGSADVMTIGALDTALAGTFTLLEVNAGAGADQVTITPSTSYAVTTDGEGGSDLLAIDTSGGAVIDVFDPLGGTVTFTSAHQTVNFSNYEVFGNSDLALTLSKSMIYAGDDLSGNTALVITVTNNGPAAAVDAAIDLGTLLTANSSLAAAVSQGTLANTGAIAVGGTVTVTITGFVTDINPATHTVSVTYVGDPNTSNNSATISSEPGFAFPAKTHINAALYTSRTSTIDGTLSDPYDKLIVGLFQGSPGIEGAVWCKINPVFSIALGGGATLDDPADVLFPDPIPATGFDVTYFGNRWRPCSKGLPFPLHVNDIFEDDNDDIWLSTWGSAGLYKSEDGGESWAAAAPDATCTSVPTNCLPNGNGGNGAWTLVYAMTQDTDGFLYISANDGLVFRSLNDGASWQQVGSLPGVASDTPWSLVAHPTTAGTLYAGTFGRGVYFTDDYGFTWSFLGGETENNVLLSNPLGDLDNPDDLYAGHIFDLEIAADDGAPGDIYLFAGTGSGIWRYDITLVPTAGAIDEGWVPLGPTVTLDDASTVVPEIRSLALGPDIDGGTPDGDPDFLLAGSWGFGAFSVADPTEIPATVTDATAIALRGQNVTFVAVGPNGSAFAGVDSGETFTIEITPAATSTANENEFSPEVPSGYALQQNYPNPFNPVTTIQFALPQTGQVRLAVYDVLGREVAVLVDGAMQAGTHGIQFDAQGLTSGTYIYRLTTEKGSFAKQLSLLK